MNTQQNKKLEKSVITKQAPEEIVRQKSVVKTKPVKEKKIKQREEGFSVYLMGANEERIKNLRKKEQIDRMMKSRLANNSKSIHNRIKCETKPEKMDQVLIESRSHSRHHPINSALITNNISSSKIIINDNKFSEASHNYKISTSKDSLNNIEDMLSNINLMNKNLASNLNKLSGDSPYNKRRRNEIKYGIVDFSSRREKSQNNSKIANKQNVDIKGTNTDETNKENESKTININLNIRSRGSLKNTFEDSTTKKVNAYTEAIDYDNMLSDHSMTNDFNKSIHKQITNYKLSINDRPISSIMNLSNLKNTQENISPANLISINRPNRPYSQIHVRTRDRLSNRNEIVTNKTEFDFQSNSNVATNTNKKLMNNLTNLNINSPNQNIISPMIINTINSTKDYHFNSNKKNDIISKINQFDEKKISKLARLLERFDNIDVEESNEFNTDNKPNKNESHIFNKKLHPINKFNTNYFPGNNQIPNNHDNNQDSLEDEIPLKLSLSKLKLNLNSSMSNKIADGLNIKRDSILVKDNSNIPNINETLRKTSLKEQEYCSPRHPQKNYKSITINLISNYGHPEKIGLTEIQIFDRTNKKINILDCRIGNSEGNIIKIFNNKFHTIDENEMWNANFADRVKLFLYFEAIYEVQFITFWNFNGKDLNKGAKEIEIIVEGNYAYRGKISKGCFNVKSNYSTTISLNSYNFNNDKYNFDIGSNFTPLSEIKSHLGQKSTINSASKIIKLEIDTSHLNNIPNAQKTLENKKVDLIFDMEENICYSNREKKLEIKEDAAGISLNLNSNILYNNISRSQASLTLDELSNLRPKSNHFISCQTVKIYFTSNWGDPNYVGLTAIEFLDDKLNPFNYNEISSFNAHPRDMNTAFGDGSDIRVLENLFNNENMVNDIENMWLTVLNRGDPPYLEICFEKMVLLSGIRIWNYNKKYELDRGVRSLEVQFDDHLFYEHSIIIRKGIGESNLDYSQSIIFPVEEILFSETDLARFSEIKPASLRLTQDFETPYLPVGFNYKITLLSNWGDPIYIGLNQIEFYDQNGDKILNHTNPRFLSFPDNLQSFSDNDNDIKSIKNSDREVSILLKYINTKIVDKIDCDPNSIFFIFDKPIIMSFIKFSNYTKNSNIAVKDFLITCDDVIIYKVNFF